MCQPLEVVANVAPTPTVPLSKTKRTQAGRPDSAPLERIPTIGYSRRGPLIHKIVKEMTEQPQTQPERRYVPRSTLIKEGYVQPPQTQPERHRGPLSHFLGARYAQETADQQLEALKQDHPLPPLASLADPAPDHLKPRSRSTGFGLTDTDVCVSLADTDDETEREPAFLGMSLSRKEEALPMSDNIETLAKLIETSSKESFSLPDKGAEQQAVVDEDDTEMPIKTTQEDKPNVAEVENAPLTAFQRMVIEGLERRTPPPGPLDPSSPRPVDDALAAVEFARKVTVLEVASQASHLPSPVSSDHEAEAPEQEKHLDHGAEADQADDFDLANDIKEALLELEDLSSESPGRALLPLEQRDKAISSKVERDADGEVATGHAGAELLPSPAPEPVSPAELAFSEPSVCPNPVGADEQDQAGPDLQAEDIDIDLAPVPVSTQDEKDRLVSRWRAGLDQAVGEGDGPSQERLQEDNNVRALDATQEEKDKLIARWHADLAQAEEGDPDQLDAEAVDELAMAFALEHDNLEAVEGSQCARSDQGPEIVEDSAFIDEEELGNAEAAGEAELPVEELPVAEATKERSSSPAEEALSEDEELGARPSAHDSEVEAEEELEVDEEDDAEDESEVYEEQEVEAVEEDEFEVEVEYEFAVSEEEEEVEADEDDFEVEVEDAFEVDEEEEFEVDGEDEFEVDGQQESEVDAEGDFFDSSYSEHDQQDGDDEQQPFEEARAFLDVIDQKEPRLAAVILGMLKDLAENPIDLDAMSDDEEDDSDARSGSSQVDDDDEEEQEEADVDEINSAYSESSERVNESLGDGEGDLEEEVDDQFSYDGGDPAGDDYDSGKGFQLHVQDLPEKANSESDGASGLLYERLASATAVSWRPATRAQPHKALTSLGRTQCPSWTQSHPSVRASVASRMSIPMA